MEKKGVIVYYYICKQLKINAELVKQLLVNYYNRDYVNRRVKRMRSETAGNQKMPEIKSETKFKSFLKYYKKNKAFYFMLIPCAIYLIVFKFIPLMGSVIAFKDYNIYEGIKASPWVGLQWFKQFFGYSGFLKILSNTLIISFYSLIFAFPAPIILASLLNEVKNMYFKRTIQTIVYLPHFLSWSIVFGLSYMLFSGQFGLVNMVIKSMGYDPVPFMQSAEIFRPFIISIGMWKEMGWGTIIFLAAMSGISPELYEAATIDGAGRWRRFTNITLPGIIPAIVTLLLMKMGSILDVGFEQIFIFLNPLNLSVGDIIDTFAFVQGIRADQYGLATAVGLFKSFVGLVLMLTFNKISKKVTGEGII
ncbi:MAG: ABC-type polysaccharide transport system, permease component [Clostridiales bacterium]|jgi:putative aldouronate transport system permease protein|nr:ABC-type polysaccharide transport system, permease component [Clostridiales bacterium]